MSSQRRVAGGIRPLVNVRDLQQKRARVLHETLLVDVLMYGSRQCYGRSAVQMDNLR